jgi:hypothetical protein
MKHLSVFQLCSILTLTLLLSYNIGVAGEMGVFNKTLKKDGISFHVSCANDSSLNNLLIVPLGLAIDNSVIKKEVDGTVTGAEVDDLNGDGSPEIYVFINSAGSGSYGSLVAYGSNNKKSLSEIYLPPLESDETNSKGYMGHDAFKVMESRLVRRFPVYKNIDSNANPTGGTRQLQYKLVSGEAGWVLKLEKSTTF